MTDSGRRHRRGLVAVFSAIAITIATAAFFTFPAGAAVRSGAAPSGTADPGTADPAGTDPTIATLIVEQDQVDVRKADKERFRTAIDGQDLLEGDTVRTDENGRATILYTDESYTRLDVSTEFTIVELTDDQGARNTNGGLGTGRVWNRVEDLAEGESFSTVGAGATAAVTGTAYSGECPTIDECTFTGVYNDVTVTGNGKKPPSKIGELQHITVKLGEPGAIEELTLEEFLADEWIQTNLTFDAFFGFAGPTIPRHVTIVTFGGAIVIPVEVGGISVNNPQPEGDPPDDPPPPPPNTGPNGYGAGGGANEGGASFDGVGNCMASAAQNKAPGSRPDPTACLGG